MPKKTKISQEDIDAFHQAMEGAKPLLQKKKVRLRPAPFKTKPVRPIGTAHENEQIQIVERQNVDEVRGEDFIAYKQAAISNKTLRKLRKGQYNVEAIVDLHGKSVEEAKVVIETFLQRCLDEGLRVVLIIHGKGRHSDMPILKNKLNHWLREIDVVLAFCSAAPSHGSRGAIYVMLKRTSEENVF